jgi:hypothetical protein
MEIDAEVVCANVEWNWMNMYNNEKTAVKSLMAASSLKVEKI